MSARMFNFKNIHRILLKLYYWNLRCKLYEFHFGLDILYLLFETHCFLRYKYIHIFYIYIGLDYTFYFFEGLVPYDSFD
jgi:hypothetical protein